MDTTQKVHLIKTWAGKTRALETQLSALKEIVGGRDEGPLDKAAYSLMGEYTRVVSKLIGDDGGACRFYDSWLEWWHFECDLGDSPSLAIAADGEEIMCATAEDLVKLLSGGGGACG